MRRITLNQLIDEIRSKQGEDTDSAFARTLGVSRQYLQGIYGGLWAPSSKIAKKLGYKRISTVTMYEELP
jgi:DNA-binding XRE family transcriptional regulator